MSSSQGSTVSFDGQLLGKLRSWKARPGTAIFREVVDAECEIVGEGESARIVKRRICLGITPGGTDITFFGRPPWLPRDKGMRGQLVITTADDEEVVNLEAFLSDFDTVGSVGERIVGSAQFAFSGKGYSEGS